MASERCYGDFSHAVRDINQWSNGYYTFIDLTRTTMVYRLAYMKKSETGYPSVLIL